MDSESHVVVTADGPLKGTTKKNLDNEIFRAFLGIPYAKPPVGKLRFKAPLPVEPWTEVKDATQEGQPCFQEKDSYSIGAPQEYIGSEDCLFLNVYTKTLPTEEKKLKPVMVYIHGGAFVNGSGGPSTHGPELLMSEDIVLVTINYRLGALGFLSLKDASLQVPGNAGLKDQVMALKWVQRNIEFFNGNANNVTIFGESAGAASVHYLMLSPSCKGLFHKAIVQSGTTLCPWATSNIDAYDLAPFLNTEAKTDEELFDALNHATVEDILRAQIAYKKASGSSLINFAPVIEQPNETEIISKPPLDIILSGEYNKVPVIFGYTSNEGLMEYFSDLLKKIKGIPIREKTLGDYLPKQLKLEKGTPIWNEIQKKMEKVYHKEENKSNPYLVTTDSLFLSGIMASIHNHLKVQTEPIYLYRLSLITERNSSRKRVKIDHRLGASHADDMGYLFTNSTNPPQIPKGSPEEISVRRFVTLWTNFAKYGNPTPSKYELGIVWEAFDKDDKTFLDIGNELVLQKNPEADRMELWKDIFKVNTQTAAYLD